MAINCWQNVDRAKWWMSCMHHCASSEHFWWKSLKLDGLSIAVIDMFHGSTVSPSPLSTCFTLRGLAVPQGCFVTAALYRTLFGGWVKRGQAMLRTWIKYEHPPAIVTSHLLWCSPCSLGLAFDPQHLDISRQSQPAKSQSSCLGEKLRHFFRHFSSFLPLVLQKNRKDPDLFQYVWVNYNELTTSEPWKS